MAGTYTHWMIAERALERYAARSCTHGYFAQVLARGDFVAAGAVAPDYPYLTELEAGLLKAAHSWADRMHFERPRGFVSRAVRNLKALKAGDFEPCLAWLCGYVSHVLADTFVHPVVNATVGGLPEFTSSEHRRCEMTQDSFIYQAVTGLEIGAGNYLDRLRTCSAPGSDGLHPGVEAFWRKTLQDNHPGAADHFDDIAPSKWHRNVLALIGVSSGREPFFRHVGEQAGLAYRSTGELTADELRRFVKEVRIPPNRTGHFRSDVFDKVVVVVSDAWHRLFQDVEAGDGEACRAYLKNWHLDAGVDLDAAEFWT